MNESRILRSYKLFVYPLVFLFASVFAGQISLDTTFFNSFLASLSGAEIILISVIALIDVNIEIGKKKEIVEPKKAFVFVEHFFFGRLLIVVSAMAYVLFKVSLQADIGEINKLSFSDEYKRKLFWSIGIGVSIIIYCIFLIRLLKQK